MFVKILSSSFLGIEPFLVEVEVDVINGFPLFNIVGLGDTTICESKDRIRSAIKNMGFLLEPKRIIINLTPASIRKSGSHFDLPMCLGIMLGMRFLKDRRNILDKYLFMGELSLTGEVRGVKGVISGVLLGKEKGLKGVIIPFENYKEASLIHGIDIVPVKNLRDVIKFIENSEKIEIPIEIKESLKIFNVDMKDVKGQSMTKRALEICGAGGHNILMVGSPGSGKSMLAKRLVTILPPMSEKEIIESTKIYSISGELKDGDYIINSRPFRDPHHTSTVTSIIGGGRVPRAGEVSLANNGVLFLDEFTEFEKGVIESLREPLEEKRVSISRNYGKMEFPANIIFIGACNPCPCGNAFDEELCVCSSYDIRRYSKKLSGPIIDRIDLYVEVYRLKESEMISEERGDSSEKIKERVLRAREIQNKRYESERLNRDMTSDEIEKYCKLDISSEKIMREAINSLNMSMRTYYKILKVARTIADLNESGSIERHHLLEAITYRKN